MFSLNLNSIWPFIHLTREPIFQDKNQFSQSFFRMTSPCVLHVARTPLQIYGWRFPSGLRDFCIFIWTPVPFSIDTVTYPVLCVTSQLNRIASYHISATGGPHTWPRINNGKGEGSQGSQQKYENKLVDYDITCLSARPDVVSAILVRKKHAFNKNTEIIAGENPETSVTKLHNDTVLLETLYL